MLNAALNVSLDADHKQMLTESLSDVLLVQTVCCFENHISTLASSNADLHSCASVADPFNSFQSHQKPVFLAISLC
jgi:hypothetical protein